MAAMEIDPVEYRLSCVLRGHEDDVRGICICGESGIATSSRDRTVRLWTADSDEKHKYSLSKTLAGHTSFVGPLAWIAPSDQFPQGAVVSGGMDTQVLLWDVSTGEIAERMKGHRYQVTGLTIDDNGDIISSSMDCTLKRWRKGQVVESWEAHKVAIQTVIKLSSGEFLSGSGDSTIKLWRGRTCLHTFVGHSDTVRGLALMPGIGVVSASHDCTVRLWALTGQVLMEMVGHTSLVYSVAACSSGLVASGSEDRFLKIWKDGACIQSIEHPGCVWDVKFLENGDVVTACSDGVVRVWTRQEDRLADLQETEDYLDQLSQYKLSRKTVGGLKLTDLPGLEALQVPGTINGQTMIISEGDNGVAYSWNSKESQWDKIGEVVDGPDDASSGQVYNGTRYDYVFDVDIGDGLPIRKLPYNRSENPYDVADKWLVKENLPLTFREQVVEFILQNSGQKTFTPDPSFRDPYTGANAYVPGESSFASGSVAPKPTFKHIPKAMDFELSKNGNQEATSNHVDDAEASTSGSGNYKHVEEETSPDLLKNTPSNIARLEDVIEQCKARHKYLARTKSPSDGEDVRWYFCKVPLADKELSAAVPKTEIVGKSDYFRFSRRDSLALEASFLQREEELLAYWWREYAECSEGPIGSRSVGKDTELDDLYVVEEERVGVPVKGGLYEVDLMRRHCFPVYWNGENRRVLRGHWYAKSGPDWIPLREDVAEQLELAYHCQVWHRRKFQPSGQFAARVDLLGTSQGAHVLFTGEDNTWEALLVLNGGSTVRLRRGFSVSGSSKPTQDELRQQKEEEMDDYCSQVSVGHLVFMIHGIGQRLEKANLIDDVVDFRRVTTSLAERHLTPYQRSTQRVLFIPCQWRKCLKLSGESAVEKITLHGVRGLRVALGATVHDVLYYMSPIYCQQIIDSVSSQLNSLYMKFLKRNPGYNGKVSLYGHSLGSVLSYDILCHQERLISLFPMDSVSFEAFNDKRDSVDGTCEPVSPTLQPETGDTNISRHVVFSDEIVTHDHNIENGEASGDFKTELEGELGRTAANNVDVVDKDMLISSLEEEVRTLKAKITQLEQYHNTANQTTKNGDSNEINGKEPNSENKHSILRKVSKLQNVKEISYKPFIRYTKLDFKVDTFFAVGSPLGVFLALRNVRIGIGRGKNYWQDAKIQEEFPSCRQMFNIFHPFDPVAYRIEPLVCEEYINIRPVIVPFHRGGNRLHIGFQEFKEDISSVSTSVATHVNSLKEKAINVLRPKGKETIEEKPESFHKKEKSYGSLMMERLTGSEEGRIDHMLQHKTFQHPYIQALGSHTNYWRDYDTALFILKHLYRDIPEEPPSDDSEPIKLFYERDPIEEETPLTFSDRVSVREFSRKARKFLK